MGLGTCQFNRDLTFLKRPRNKCELPYSHWGRTDHGELRSPCQRRGTGSSTSGNSYAAGLSHTPLPSLPVVLLPELVQKNVCQPTAARGLIKVKVEGMKGDRKAQQATRLQATSRRSRPSAGDEVPRRNHLVAASSLVAAIRATDLPSLPQSGLPQRRPRSPARAQIGSSPQSRRAEKRSIRAWIEDNCEAG